MTPRRDYCVPVSTLGDGVWRLGVNVKLFSVSHCWTTQDKYVQFFGISLEEKQIEKVNKYDCDGGHTSYIARCFFYHPSLTSSGFGASLRKKNY